MSIKNLQIKSQMIISREAIIKIIDTLTDEEIVYLKETTDFILFKRINSLISSKESLLKVMQSKGFDSFEDLILKIKKSPFNRSSFDYIIGKHLISWIMVKLDCTDEQANNIIKISVKMGMLTDSGLGNYK